MRRLLLIAALAAGLSGTTGTAQATEVCVANINWACVYSDGGYWCHRVEGGGNWTEYCVGATGVRQCWKTFDVYDCQYIPGQITH